MTSLTVGSQPFDMTDWDLSDIANGSVTSSSATEVDVTGFGGTLVYQIKGSGFTSFDADGLPASGTVTSFVQQVPGHVATDITGFSISAASFSTFVENNDAAGLEAAIFSGNDVLYGRTGDDVLLGFGGNDSFNETKGGNDTVQGGDGNDSVSFGDTFTAADSVDGGAGKDTVKLSGDYSAGVTFGASTMTNVEVLKLDDGFSYNLTLNAASDTSGQSLNVAAQFLTGANHAAIDASAVTGALRLAGGDGDDSLSAGSGVNTLLGGSGDDTITIQNFAAGSVINGGDGNNTLLLNGDFSTHTDLVKSSVSHIGTFAFAAGHDYDVSIDTTSNHAPGTATQELFADASALGASDSVTLDWNVGNRNQAEFTGGAGDDSITFDMSQVKSFATDAVADMSHGGSDTVIGSYSPGGSVVVASFGGAFDSTDVVQDAEIELNGDYSAGVTLNAADTPTRFTFITGTFDYNLTFLDSNIAPGQTLTLDAEDLNTGTTLTFDGSAVTSGGNLFVTDNRSNLNFIGTSGGDRVDVAQGAVHISGGSGDDQFTVSSFVVSDSIDGGGGSDSLQLAGATGTYHVNSSVLSNIESLGMHAGMNFVLSGNIISGGSMTVREIGSPGGLSFDGSAETTGSFTLIGGTGGNILKGGANADTIQGGNGANFITGNGGADTITCNSHPDQLFYKAVADSTSTTFDNVIGFDTAHDVFKLFTSVSGVDANVTTGSLSNASFDSDLAADIGSGQLAAGHAVVFTASGGDYNGHTFLIVDCNGVAGYQASQDLVIELTNPSSLTLTTSNFA
ncbi:MAG TPA: calcium-binding protein [Rhizomicrobium sp.]|nr:calcium-binding protein [Rhizomicrobium sp.]